MKRMRLVVSVVIAVGVLASMPVFAVTHLSQGGSDGCGGIPIAIPGPLHVQGISATGSLLERLARSFGGDSGGVGGVPVTKPGSQGAGFSGEPHGAGGIPWTVRMDPRSVGGIPWAGQPAYSTHLTVPHALIVGLVIDSSNAPIAGAPVLILSFDGKVIAATTTDASGAFALNLPKVSGLTLTLPSLNLFDVPVTAGDPLLILIP